MKYVPDPYYNPDFQDKITSRTKLAPGITMAKFLGGYADPVTLDYITTEEEKKRIARQLLMHADAMTTVRQPDGEFSDHRLIVAEGLYRPEPLEKLDIDSINYFMKTGQAVVYELLNKEGKINPSKTFDLAVYWKDNLNFDKLILDYDTYDPSGILNVQIILILPKIISPWNVEYSNIVETRFNNFVQATNELVECKLNSTENIQVYS